jgi:hypothetical protein
MPTCGTGTDAARSSATATSPSGRSGPASDLSRSSNQGSTTAGPEQREKFTSAIPPPYLRKTKSLEGLIPWLDLKGVSTGDLAEALQALLGPDAPGRSAATLLGGQMPQRGKRRVQPRSTGLWVNRAPRHRGHQDPLYEEGRGWGLGPLVPPQVLSWRGKSTRPLDEPIFLRRVPRHRGALSLGSVFPRIRMG